MIQTYTHYEAAKLNAALFVTLADYQRLRDAARAVVDAYEEQDSEVDPKPLFDALAAVALEPTV